MDLIATHPIIAKKGLNAVLQSYDKNKKKFRTALDADLINTKEQYYKAVLEGDFGMAPIIGDGSPIGLDTFDLPFETDFYWSKRALGHSVSSEKVESDQYGVVKKWATKFAIALHKTEEAVAFNMLNLSFTTALTMDGVSAINTAHLLDSGTASNRGVLVAGSYVDVALTYEGVMQATAEMMLQKGHRGDPMPCDGPFKLHCHPRKGWIADTIVKSNKRPGSGDNDATMAPEYITGAYASPYLTNDDYWWLKATDTSECKNLVKLQFRGPQTHSRYVERTDSFEYYANVVYAYHWMDWRNMWGTTG